VRPESTFRRNGLPHMSEVCCELGSVEVVLLPDLLDDELGEHDPLRRPDDAGACRASPGPRALAT
jgi:hypothetical protein